jgi:Putative DNA-binding domain
MPVQVSSARAFFDEISGFRDPNEAFAFLAEIPSRSQSFFEEECIDFKGHWRDENDEKKNWSKALSGYANITDGVIVWGIDARNDPVTEVDFASGLKLIPDTRILESHLRDWIRDATNPPVMGVEFKSYPGSDGGFVVCFIPESAHKPHRAEWAQKHYYYRAEDDFLEAEPAMLRLLFYPRYSPAFSIEVSLGYSGSKDKSLTNWRADFRTGFASRPEFKDFKVECDVFCNDSGRQQYVATFSQIDLVQKNEYKKRCDSVI